MAITLNNIAKRLEAYVDNHHFLERFSRGDREDIDVLEGVYPLLHLVPIGSVLDSDEKSKTYDLALVFADRPTAKEDKVAFQQEVQSDMEQCAEDLINDIKNGGSVFKFDELWGWDTAGIEYFNEDDKHTLSGVVLSIGLKVPYTFDACSLPLEGVTPVSSACADAIVKSTGSHYSTTIASGGTLIVGDSTIRNSDSSWSTTLEATENLTLADFPIAATDGSNNTAQLVDVPYDPSGYTFSKIAVKQQDDSTEGFGRIAKTIKLMNADISSVTETASEIQITGDITTASGIAYCNQVFSQRTSYRTGDEGWTLQNNVWHRTPPTYPEYIQGLDYDATNPFVTLEHNNAFGNKNRFTDETGAAATSGSNTTSGLVIDHLHGYMWYAPRATGVTWATAVDNCVASTQGGYSDWYLPSRDSIKAITPAGANTTPTPGFTAGDMKNIWTSTTLASSTTYAMIYYATGSDIIGYIRAKTSTYAHTMIRKHY